MVLAEETTSESSALTREFVFEHLSSDDGLSGETVYSLLQDRVGFLWIGTEAGLSRYNGYGFEVAKHDPNDPGSLASDDISFILEDSAGYLWLATWGGGLDRLDPVNKRFVHHHSDPSLPGALRDEQVQHLLIDSQDVFWLGTRGHGLARFDRDTSQFTTFRHDPANPQSLCNDRVWRILEDLSGILWLGTGDGLCVFDRRTETFRRYGHIAGDPTSLSDNQVRTLYVDRSGTLWVGTGKGLNRFDRASATFERFEATPGGLSHGVINSLFEDSQGTFWIGTRGGGLNLLDRSTGAWRALRHDPRDSSSLSDDDVRAIIEDRSSVLWVATRQGGLNKLDLKPKKFEHFRETDEPGGLSNAQVRAFAQHPDGRLWIATAAGLEWRGPERAGAHSRHAAGLPSLDVHRLTITRAGDLWVGAGRSGLHRVRTEGSERLVTYRHDANRPQSLADDRVTALLEGRSGNLWIGTTGGLDRFEPAVGDDSFEHQKHSMNDPRSLSDNFVTALLEDSEGSLWVGTNSGGLNRADGRSGFVRYQTRAGDSSSLSNNHVTTLYQQASGTLWVGTAEGLNELKSDGTFRRILEEDGLEDAQIAGILGDEKGRLWVSTPQSLSRIDPTTGIVRNYTDRDGLQAERFNPGATFRGGDGNLCFGGNGGYNCFDPDAIRDNPHAPPVVLVSFERFGEAMDLGRATWATETIRLSHEDSFFSFGFAALDFTDPDENRYRYKLEGYDRDWVDAGSNRTASYSNVIADDYIFRVQGANSDGVWNEDGVEVAVSIAPPFWQTAWFRVLAVLGIVVLCSSGYNFRIRHLRRRENELSRRLDARMVQLRRSEERYRLLFERNLAGVVRATTDGKILDCNEAFARILGYETPQDCQRMHRLELGARHHGQASLLAQMAESGAVVGREVASRRRDGSVLSLLWNANLVPSENGEPNVVEGTVIDVSERQRIDEGLRRAQKLESLGVLAGGIAHDFNNLLMSILGNAELGRIGLDPASKVYRRLQKIETAAESASGLSRQMLAYSGKGEFVIGRLDLSAAIRQMAHLLEGAVTKKAHLVFDLEEALPMVEADAGQVEQVVMSLITNASEALGAGEGSITVRTRVGEFSSAELAESYLDDRLKAGAYVALSVADDGCGMDDELQLKIFDPFFTTKFTGRGLGLAAVLGIVRGHRGAIKIASEPGRGSTFTILFPTARDQSSAAIDVPWLAPAAGRPKILVVDDDEAVRQVANDMVEAMGFEGVTANDGQEAVELFENGCDDFALVILDLAMPRMSGEEAFRAIREISPSAHVILASGYDEKESTRLFAGQGLSGFVQKPYRMGLLKERIEEILGPHSTTHQGE